MWASVSRGVLLRCQNCFLIMSLEMCIQLQGNEPSQISGTYQYLEKRQETHGRLKEYQGYLCL